MDSGGTSTVTGTGTGTGLYFLNWCRTKICQLDSDGSVAPDYMTSNPSGYMYADLSDCCAKQYNWIYDTCAGMGSDGTGTGTGTGLYFPNWSSSNQGCVNDGNEPDYMTSTSYMYADLYNCCTKH